MGSSNPLRKFGDIAKEDVRGEKTIIGYDETEDKIGHLGVSSTTNAVKIDKELYKSKRYEWSAGDLIYKGVNVIVNASTSATDWNIWKYTWSAGDLTYKQGPAVGSWEGRAALGW